MASFSWDMLSGFGGVSLPSAINIIDYIIWLKTCEVLLDFAITH